MAVVISPAAGQLIDRFEARLTLIAAGVALAAGYGGQAFAHTPAEAFAAAACAGAGNGVLSPSQTTRLTTLAAPDIGHRVTAVYRALFCGACLLVEAADASRALAVALLVVAVIAARVGECLHTTALTPLVAELAPAHLRGRYMAAMGLCFWIGVAAGLALAAAVAMLRLERRLPEAARRTPRPGRTPGQVTEAAR